MSTAPICAFVAFAVASTVAHAQPQIQIFNGEVVQTGPPVRPLKTGTGRIRGRVISAETGAPIRRAQVRLSANDVGAKAAMTDSQGRYEFADLPEGRFTITASKSGYVSVQYGQIRPSESGRPIELADKQVIDKADILMPRGSVISGRIVDEFGDAVTDAMVTALRQSWVNGRRRLVPSGRIAQTNDLGQFRLYGLPPGDYYVGATLRNPEGIMVEMIPGNAVSGSVSAAPSSGYASTYFPGTVTPSDAQKISVSLGQEVQGTDFALLAVRFVRISGVVLNTEGKPVEGTMVTVAAPRGAEGAFALMPGSTARTNKDGAFTLNNVAPGDYTLQVRSMTVRTMPVGDSMSFTTRVEETGGAEFASVPVSVGGEDLSNVVITTTRGASATGRVTFEGNRPPSATSVRIIPAAADVDSIGPPGLGGTTTKADGTFELKGLSGARLLRVAGLPPGWGVKSVEVNGSDVTDSGIDFKGTETFSGIEIVVAAPASVISGLVTQSDGAAVKDYTAIVFAEDPQKWTLPSTRWVSGVRPDQEGRFRIQAMPPGNYYAIAVEYAAQGEWGDPELLDRLKSKATRFVLGEAESKILDLRISDR